MVFASPGATTNGTKIEAPGAASSCRAGREYLLPDSTSRQTSCGASTPRIQARFTFVAGSSTQIARETSRHGSFLILGPCKMNPLAVGVMRSVGRPLLNDSSRIAKKFGELKENTASIGAALRFVKRYSIAATGKLELSASPGMNGLQPLRSTSSGILSS